MKFLVVVVVGPLGTVVVVVVWPSAVVVVTVGDCDCPLDAEDGLAIVVVVVVVVIVVGVVTGELPEVNTTARTIPVIKSAPPTAPTIIIMVLCAWKKLGGGDASGASSISILFIFQSILSLTLYSIFGGGSLLKMEIFFYFSKKHIYLY